MRYVPAAAACLDGLEQGFQITPDPSTPSGYVVRSALRDVLDVFEINRKECARLLLEYPKWTIPSTFKAQPGAPDTDPGLGKGWQLESTLVEVRDAF